MSGPTDDDLPSDDETPKAPRPAVVAPPRRMSPEEMFPPEEEEAPPDVFDQDVRRSHRQHKQQVEAFARLGKELVELPPHQLGTLDLDPEFHQAVAGCRDLRKTARVRELRRIATLLRHRDARAIRDRLDEVAGGDRAKVQQEKELERWRERLIDGGDAELSAFVEAYPNADRQRFRQLVRSAGKDRTKGKAVHAYRTLLREIRATAQAGDED